MVEIYKIAARTAICASLTLMLICGASAQAKRTPSKRAATAVAPVVTRIDIEGLRSLIKPKGKPLLINFWATWCDPCRAEFPELVEVNEKYKGKIDFVTVSLDDLAEIRTSVPKFLREVKATMPAYLLKTPDESAAISLVAKDWSGNLPMTVLFSASGDAAYTRMGIIKKDVLMAEIDKLLAPAAASGSF